MNKLYLSLTAALLSLISLTAWADTEVTALYITNPSFESATTGWTVSNMVTQGNDSFDPFKEGKTYLEKWVAANNGDGKVGNASVTQTINALPAGTYKLIAAAQNLHQADSKKDTPQTGAVIFAGTDETTVTVCADYEVNFTATGANVQIGFRCTNATGNWVGTDNFRLYMVTSSFEGLTSYITKLEALQESEMEPTVKNNLDAALLTAKAVTSESSTEEITTATAALVPLMTEVSASIAVIKELKSNITTANTITIQSMSPAVKKALDDAIAAAQAILEGTSEADAAAANTALTTATAEARSNHTAYNQLATQIRQSNNTFKEESQGADTMKDAIDAAQKALDAEDATTESYQQALDILKEAYLIYRTSNAIGNAPKVTTGTVVQGATVIFARGTFPSSYTEAGFCYSTTNPEPTIFDERTTQKYSNYGDIYHIDDLQPATVYYVRAYAISRTYAVGYGDVVKTYTRPMGNATYSYGNEGDADQNARILAAVQEAVWMWNNVAGVTDFHLSAHYVWGVGDTGGTADCTYGGYMRISQNAAYQRTGTVLHEGSHGLGVIGNDNYHERSNWHSNIYRTNYKTGTWLGHRVDRVIQFLENTQPDVTPPDKVYNHLEGDKWHMWPYGINGASQDTGAPMLYRGNALVIGALFEDGLLSPSMDFARPAYTFTQDDQTKYYIKNESADRGLTTSYLTMLSTGGLNWVDSTAAVVLSDDHFAWYITFDPVTCYYQLTNAATNKCISYTGTAFRSALPTASNRDKTSMQLLPSRTSVSADGYTFAGQSYWIVKNKQALSANLRGLTAAAGFNHANSATTQRWLLMSANDVVAFAKHQGIDLTPVKSVKANTKGQLDAIGTKGAISLSAHGESQQATIYSLDGRLVKQAYLQAESSTSILLPRGIYVVNGKKVIVH